jgi:hypothetical protein
MSIGATIATVLVGSTGLSGVCLTIWVRLTNRRGRARLLHEDMWRMQSTIVRLFYQTGEQGERPNNKAWMLPRLADPEAQQDVLAHLSRWPLSARWRFSACASAIGWGEYLREAYEQDEIPADGELGKIYERLAVGRVALSRLARVKYRTHSGSDLIEDPQDRRRNEGNELPVIKKREARHRATARTKSPAEASGRTLTPA